MNTHKNARLTVHNRQVLVRRVIEQRLRPVDAAQAMAVSPRTAYKRLARYRSEDWARLSDHSCRPHRNQSGSRHASSDCVASCVFILRSCVRPACRVRPSRVYSSAPA